MNYIVRCKKCGEIMVDKACPKCGHVYKDSDYSCYEPTPKSASAIQPDKKQNGNSNSKNTRSGCSGSLLTKAFVWICVLAVVALFIWVPTLSEKSTYKEGYEAGYDDGYDDGVSDESDDYQRVISDIHDSNDYDLRKLEEEYESEIMNLREEYEARILDAQIYTASSWYNAVEDAYGESAAERIAPNAYNDQW